MGCPILGNTHPLANILSAVGALPASLAWPDQHPDVECQHSLSIIQIGRVEKKKLAFLGFAQPYFFLISILACFPSLQAKASNLCVFNCLHSTVMVYRSKAELLLQTITAKKWKSLFLKHAAASLEGAGFHGYLLKTIGKRYFPPT